MIPVQYYDFVTNKKLHITKAKLFMYDFFIPTLHKVLSEKNPEKYKEWNGNCCRQTAIFGASILTYILPFYEWEVWEGTFKDKVTGRDVKYEHAWIYGKFNDKITDMKSRLLIDLSRQFQERIFEEVPGNRYPKDKEDYKYMVELNRKKLDWQSMLDNEIEYLTGLHSRDVLFLLLQKINKILLNE